MPEKSASLRSSGKEFLKKYNIIFILLAMIILLSIAKPVFLRTANLLNMVRQVSLIGILSMGMMLVIINGGVDLSAGSQIAMTSVICAVFAQPGMPLFLSILMPIVGGLCCGLVNGFLITGPKIPAFIATLGMMSIARGFALLFSNGQPVSGVNDMIIWLGSARVLKVPVLIYIFLLCAVLVHVMLRFTGFGKKIYALGGNEQAARVCGINVEATRMKIYLLNSTFAAICGILITGRVSSGAVSNGLEYHLDAIAAAVIGGVSMSGGVGSVFGVVIGVLIMGVLQNGLDLLQVSPYWQLICKGAIIIVAVVADNMRKNRRVRA